MTGAPEELKRWTAVAEYLLPSVLVEALLKRSRVLARLALPTCVGVWFPESIPP